MATHGKIKCFDPSEGNWTSYIKRLDHYFEANDVQEDKKKSTFLAVCQTATFELAKNLIQPSKLKEQDIGQNH